MAPDLDTVVFPSLKDRVAIVTGAGQGIGRVFARAFARAGARTVIAEVNEAKAAAVAGEIMQTGGQALAVTTDVADEASIREMVEVVEDEYGRIDVLGAVMFLASEAAAFVTGQSINLDGGVTGS